MARRKRTIDLQAAGRGIVIQIQGDGESARKALEMVQEQMRRTREAAEEDTSLIAEGWERVRGAIESVGLYMGVREVISGVKELIGGSMELGEQMLQASQKTGLAVETLSTLRYAASVTGQDFDGLVGGIGRMNKVIADAADGDKKASTFMQGLGLNAKDLAGRTDGAEAAFHKFIQTLAATETTARRNQLAMELMGRAGIAQVPVLIDLAQHWDEYRQKAEDAGMLLNSQTAEALAETDRKMKQFEQSIKGAGVELAEGLSPGLRDMFNVIDEGKGNMNALVEFGHFITRVLAGAGAAAYGFGSALAGLASLPIFDMGDGQSAALKAMADSWAHKADEMRSILLHGSQPGPEEKPPLPGTGTGFGGAPEGEKDGKAKALKSDNSIHDARAALAAEQAKAAADALKVFDEQRLAELEAQHRMELVTDSEFYAEKLALQNEMLDAEEDALKKRQASLQDLYKKQQGDKTLHRDKTGTSAEELRTQRELLAVQEQIGQLEARRGQNNSANEAEAALGARNAELANLRAAAELEKQKGQGIAAQVALLREEADLEAKKVSTQGGTAAAQQQIRDLAEVKAKMLEIGEVERQITATEASYRQQEQEVQDRQAKGIESKRAAEQQLNQLREQEVAALATLAQQYQQLADTLGGPFKQKADELWASLSTMATPSQKGSGQFGQELAKGVTSMADTIAEQSLRGKTSFKAMTQEMEADLAKLALKLLETKLMGSFGGGSGGTGGAPTGSGGGFGGGISDFFGKIFGALGEHHMSGGVGSDMPQVVGEAGPEVWTPPTRGGSYTPNNVLSKVAESGGGGGAPKVTTNVINQTSNPVQSQPSQVSWNAQLREFVIHTVLEDTTSGGSLSHLNPNNG